MPVYVYRCDAGHEFEVEQRITADPLTTCPSMMATFDRLIPDHCCGSPCERIPTVTSFVLKGPRWAKDGYS